MLKGTLLQQGICVTLVNRYPLTHHCWKCSRIGEERRDESRYEGGEEKMEGGGKGEGCRRCERERERDRETETLETKLRQ